MPKPQKSKWGNDIRLMDWNCVMQLPLLLLSPPQLFSPPLSSAALLSSSSAALLSSSTALLFRHSPFLLFSLPFFLLQAPGLGYPVPICHPNLIKDWLANWHKSVWSMSDQHWSQFDHCSCIWFVRKLLITRHNLTNNKTDVECRETFSCLRIINPDMNNHFAKQSPLLF